MRNALPLTHFLQLLCCKIYQAVYYVHNVIVKCLAHHACNLRLIISYFTAILDWSFWNSPTLHQQQLKCLRLLTLSPLLLLCGRIWSIILIRLITDFIGHSKFAIDSLRWRAGAWSPACPPGVAVTHSHTHTYMHIHKHTVQYRAPRFHFLRQAIFTASL